MTTTSSEAFVSSQKHDAESAANELIKQAFEDNEIEEADFAFLFTSSKFDTEKLADKLDNDLDEKCENWIGCTTAGEISNQGSSLGGAVLLIVKSDQIEFNVGKSENTREDSIESGREAVKKATSEKFQNSDKNKLIFTIMPGLTLEKPGVEFNILKGMAKELGSEIPVVGGSAGDDGAFKGNRQILNGEVMEDTVIAASILTDHEITVGKEHGFNNKTASGVVSDAEGRVLKEISGQPAAEFYAENTGLDIEELKDTFEAPTGVELSNTLRYALEKGIAEEISQDEMRLITPLEVTEENGLFMTVEVEEKNLVHVVEGAQEEIVKAGKNAFKHHEDDENFFAILSDCTCRNMAMEAEELEEEVRLLKEHFNCPIAGFYGYGEIGGKEGNFCTFQNQTVSGFVVHD